jgi:hypothetical protein
MDTEMHSFKCEEKNIDKYPFLPGARGDSLNENQITYVSAITKGSTVLFFRDMFPVLTLEPGFYFPHDFLHCLMCCYHLPDDILQHIPG